MTDNEFTLINNRFDTIETLVGGVNQRLDTLNGKVYEHSIIINEAIGERKMARENQKSTADKVQELETRVNLVEKAELQHVINCPISPKLRNIEDKLLSQTAVRKYMAGMFAGGVALGGLIIALLKLIIG
jgi:hypothetical protein